jgi:hypothetical protein
LCNSHRNHGANGAETERFAEFLAMSVHLDQFQIVK